MIFSPREVKKRTSTWQCYHQGRCAKGGEELNKAQCWMWKVEVWCRKKCKVGFTNQGLVKNWFTKSGKGCKRVTAAPWFPHTVQSIPTRGKDGYMAVVEMTLKEMDQLKRMNSFLLLPRAVIEIKATYYFLRALSFPSDILRIHNWIFAINKLWETCFLFRLFMCFFFSSLSQGNFCGHEWAQEGNLSCGERQTSQSPQNSKLLTYFGYLENKMFTLTNLFCL